MKTLPPFLQTNLSSYFVYFPIHYVIIPFITNKIILQSKVTRGFAKSLIKLVSVTPFLSNTSKAITLTIGSFIYSTAFVVMLLSSNTFQLVSVNAFVICSKNLLYHNENFLDEKIIFLLQETQIKTSKEPESTKESEERERFAW